jgi:hypothetical protein
MTAGEGQPQITAVLRTAVGGCEPVASQRREGKLSVKTVNKFPLLGAATKEQVQKKFS